MVDISGKTIGDFAIYFWAWLGASLIILLFGRLGVFTWFYAAAYSLMDLDMNSFKATMAHSSDFFANNFAGSLVTKFNRFNRSLNTVTGAILFELNALAVQILFPFVILLFISPLIALIFIGWAIIYGLSLVHFHKKKFPRATKVAEYDSRVTGFAADAFTNVLPVKMFASLSAEIHLLEKLSLKRVKARLRNMFAGDYIRVYKLFANTTLQIVIMFLSIQLALNGKMSIADVILIQLYMGQLRKSLWDFGKLVETLEEAFADAAEMVEIFDLEPSVQDSENPIHVGQGDIKGQIVLENVDFRYEGIDESDVFKDLSLTIPIGQKVGLVGPSGGGKTTFTRLLLRFMDIDSGQISIDGFDISKIPQDELRRNIAYVPQEPLLFHRTIFDNIAYGNPKASKEQVMAAAKLAHADEFINKLPQGYETLVGERGVKLSGGQKQRVAIARAMLKEAPILLLDEATSALDSKSEKLITSALNNLMKNRTTIVIAHRLSTIKKLDRIILLKEGRAVEDGTHDELLAKKGDYAELWQHQHGGFIDD